MSVRQITIVEVGPRDGLQSEPEILPTESKVKFILVVGLPAFVLVWDWERADGRGPTVQLRLRPHA